MRKTIVSALIAIVAIAGNTTVCNAGTISKCKTKKVSAYFSYVLNGESATYKSSDKVKPTNIEATRKAVWECWRNAVIAVDEEKLTTPLPQVSHATPVTGDCPRISRRTRLCPTTS